MAIFIVNESLPFLNGLRTFPAYLGQQRCPAQRGTVAVLPSPRLRVWPASRYPAAMVDDIDIYREALTPIYRHGDQAAVHAALEADARLEDGNLDGAAAWHRILDAIKQIQNKNPTGTVH